MTRTSKTYSFFLLYILLNIVSSVILLMTVDYYSMDPMLYNIIGQLVLFLPVILIGTKIFYESPKTTFSIYKSSVADIIAAIVLTFAIGPMTSLMSLIMAMFFPNVVSADLAVAYQSPLWTSIVSICVIPAVCEELIFRGIIFSGFKNLSLKKACVMGGLIFAIAHFDPQQLLYTFAVGVLFCYIVYRTKSIFPTIVSHFSLNFSQLMLSRISFASVASETAADTVLTNAMLLQYIGHYFILSVFSIPIILYIVSLMGRKYGRGKSLFADVLQPKKEFIIEDETVFDYAPQRQFEEKILNWQLILILIFYILFTLLL